jgi:predicted ATP-binding protein involved in virulence
MNISSVKIFGLFEIFNYDISFENGSNVLIITGPNGFGKTMVLNIISNFFGRRFSFFQKLIFSKIELSLDDGTVVHMRKITGDDKKKKGVKDTDTVEFAFGRNGRYLDRFVFPMVLKEYFDSDTERYLNRNTSFRSLGENVWFDARSGNHLSSSEVFDYLQAGELSRELSNGKLFSGEIEGILNSINVHLIREQRLFKKVLSRDRADRAYREVVDNENVMSDTIQVYAEELRDSIAVASKNSFLQTQELDSSYPARLRGERNVMNEIEYGIRYRELKKKQETLTRLGLYDSTQEFLTYSQEDAKALSVYIKDLEKKLGVFDALLKKLELFTNILNKRRFTFKSIKISREKGFFFETIAGKPLELGQLSSGEQHEVILLYELIFNVKENVLVLIDEPEISLHVTWQKEFLSDLFNIIQLQNIQVVIATHSPSIINGRWDLVYNLEKVSQ